MKPNMRIVITGGTGFLGRPVASALVDAGHSVTILTRASRVDGQAQTSIRAVPWTPDGSAGAWASELDGADAVVNLAGESIAARRWTAAQKERILESRRLATRSVVAAIARASRPPSLLLNGSAVGYYGPCGDEVVTE